MNVFYYLKNSTTKIGSGSKTTSLTKKINSIKTDMDLFFVLRIKFFY